MKDKQFIKECKECAGMAGVGALALCPKHTAEFREQNGLPPKTEKDECCDCCGPHCCVEAHDHPSETDTPKTTRDRVEAVLNDSLLLPPKGIDLLTPDRDSRGHRERLVTAIIEIVEEREAAAARMWAKSHEVELERIKAVLEELPFANLNRQVETTETVVVWLSDVLKAIDTQATPKTN